MARSAAQQCPNQPHSPCWRRTPLLCRNYLHVMRHWGAQRAQRHMPEFAKRIVAEYDKDGAVAARWVRCC